MRNDGNIAAVAASISTVIFTISRLAKTGAQTSTWRILLKDQGLHTNKIVLTQKLKPNDHKLRREFADWACQHLEHDTILPKKSSSQTRHIPGWMSLLIYKITGTTHNVR